MNKSSRRRFLKDTSLAMAAALIGTQLAATPSARAEASSEARAPRVPDREDAPARPRSRVALPCRVAIARGTPDDTKSAAREAIELAGGFTEAVSGARQVLIKPNLTIPALPESAICTDVGVVEAVIELLGEADCNNIVVAEGPGDDPKRQAFAVTGYSEAMSRLGVRVVDLNFEKTRTVPVPRGLAYQKLDIPEIVLQSDVVIDVAKLKTHNEALVTLGAKNLFGVPPVSHYNYNTGPRPRAEFHAKGLHKVIRDICSVVPIAYTIIDGVLAMEGDGPASGTPVPAGIVIAGQNLLATDVVACHTMGVDPREVAHLTYLYDSGFGPLDLDQIELAGEPLEEVARRFRRPGEPVG